MNMKPDTSAITIRLATADDLPAINDIYNHYVLNSTCTYQEVPETMEGRKKWFEHHGGKHPVTVAVLDGQIVGWGSLSTFHSRSAYRFAVENSVYLDHRFLGQGIGSLVLKDLIDRAKALGHHTIVAGADAEQAASLALHRKLGFVEVAHFKQVGFKFGRWLDVIYMQVWF
jgi:L-amino acid N-acyltransferase YncA